MFNVGGGELIVIMLIALIVLGPKRLPDAARQIGKVMGDLRRLSTSFQSEVRTALDTADDPNQVAPRRNVLATEEAAATAPEPHPVRTEPLVAKPIPPDPES
jgi:sec-independent protein translocase protein TatB